MKNKRKIRWQMNEKIREMKSGLKKMYIIIVVIVYQ